jgi:hypothetical protein
MSYCKNCGKELEDEVVICPYCHSSQISFDDAKKKSTDIINKIAKKKILIGLFLIVIILGVGFLYWNSQKITIDESTYYGDYTGNYNLLTKSGIITLNYNNNNTHTADETEYTVSIINGKFKINVNGNYKTSNNNGTWTNNITGHIDKNGDVVANTNLNIQSISLYATSGIGYYTGNYDPQTKSGIITFNLDRLNRQYIPDKKEYTASILDGRFRINIKGTYNDSIVPYYYYSWTNNITGHIDNDGDVVASGYDYIDRSKHSTSI